MIKFTYIALALALGAVAALPAAAQTTAPATPAPEAPSAAPVTDEELTKFAKAALAVDAVTKDTSIPAAEKNAKLTEAVTGAGLDNVRFNQIATLAQSDPAMNAKVQAAIIAVRDGPQATPPGPAPTPSAQ